MLAYARCMRADGLPNFPDPDASGNLRLNGQPGSDLDRSSPRFRAADRACKSLMPPPETLPKNAQALRYARCMRAHGISDFPDLRPDGATQIQPTPGSDLDLNSPRFKAATQACTRYLPGGGAGGGSVESTSGAS
jgi:hypothetical protein